MSFTTLLHQRCDIVRGTEGDKRAGMPPSPTWSKIKIGVECRLDTAVKFQSRLEAINEEYIGRLHGIMWFDPTVDVLTRDIILIDSEQYDVQFVDKIQGYGETHHKQATVSLRDEPVILT